MRVAGWTLVGLLLVTTQTLTYAQGPPVGGLVQNAGANVQNSNSNLNNNLPQNALQNAGSPVLVGKDIVNSLLKSKKKKKRKKKNKIFDTDTKGLEDNVNAVLPTVGKNNTGADNQNKVNYFNSHLDGNPGGIPVGQGQVPDSQGQVGAQQPNGLNQLKSNNDNINKNIGNSVNVGGNIQSVNDKNANSNNVGNHIDSNAVKNEVHGQPNNDQGLLAENSLNGDKEPVQAQENNQQPPPLPTLQKIIIHGHVNPQDPLIRREETNKVSNDHNDTVANNLNALPGNQIVNNDAHPEERVVNNGGLPAAAAPGVNNNAANIIENNNNNVNNVAAVNNAGGNSYNNFIPNNNNNNDNSNNQLNNNNMLFGNNNQQQQQQQHQQSWNAAPNQQNNWQQAGAQQPEQPKKEKMQISWDWSDFLVSYEKYVFPEQKVRRAPHATTGEPWPLPQYYVAADTKLYRLDKDAFRIQITKESCDIIERAAERYREYILYDSVTDMYDNLQHAQGTYLDDVFKKYQDDLHTQAPYLTSLNIKIRQRCGSLPNDKMDESYDLFVKKTGAFLWANEVWGALRGLETFSQIVFKGTNDELYVKDTVVNDYPRFSHRGIHIDTSRHFLFKEIIFDVLEGMAQNKMNVLHWHIVDDQSFPYESKIYPELSKKGAYHPTFVYSHDDIEDIIDYARMRGIRVMPEFDTPGHTYSWGLSRPDLMTQCYQGNHPVHGYVGPLDPSKNETFRFLKNLFNEVLHVFKDEYIHLGGDEVPMTCWSSNPEVLLLLNTLNGKPDTPINLNNVDPYMYSYEIRRVLEYYEKRLTQDLKELGKRRKNGVRFVMWQEIMNNDVKLPNDTIIQIWQGDMGDVQRAIDSGYQALYSTCWYLDLIEYGVKWPKYYNCDPADTSMGYQIDEKKVLGGEACIWAEYVDNENLISTLWPRASAIAERLWSAKDVRDVDAAGKRLSEHRCRMLSRGLSVGQISGPDYCLRRGHRRDRGNSTGNCTMGLCGSNKEVLQIEKVNIRVQQGHQLPDCNQIISSSASTATIILVLVAVVIVFAGVKMGGNRFLRLCKNKNIFIAFIVIIFIYFMCTSSLWMSVMEFRGSFEKHYKSHSDKG